MSIFKIFHGGKTMQNDWEFFDNFEWVAKWFIWLRIFNNFVNMVIWSFWTWAFFSAVWVFFLERQINFLGYYVFLYSLNVTAFFLVYLDEYLYHLDRFLRDEQRRIRIERFRAEDARLEKELGLPKTIYAADTRRERDNAIILNRILRAKDFVRRARKYPSVCEIIGKKNFSMQRAMFMLDMEEKSAVLDLKIQRLTKEVEEMDKELRPFLWKRFRGLDIEFDE